MPFSSPSVLRRDCNEFAPGTSCWTISLASMGSDGLAEFSRRVSCSVASLDDMRNLKKLLSLDDAGLDLLVMAMYDTRTRLCQYWLYGVGYIRIDVLFESGVRCHLFLLLCAS